MIKKLRIKLVLAAMLSLFLVLTILIGTAGIFNYRRVISNADQTLAILVENDGKFPEYTLGKGPGSNRPMSPELPYESRYFSVVLDADGNTVSVNTGKIAAIDASDAESYAASAFRSNKTNGFKGDYRYILSDTSDNSADTRIIFLDCGRNLDNLHSFLFTSIAVSLIGLFSVFLILLLLSERIVKPFSESYEKQKRFITDAGHELKTPLTIINADADILTMDYGDSEWLSDIKTQTKRLADLTKDLIFLSRMEEDRSETDHIEFPISDIAEDTLRTFQSVAKTQNKVLIGEIEPLIAFTGNEKEIRQLLNILLDNALKYSEEGGQIILTIKKQKKQLLLSVYNTTESITKDSLVHLFDRFYRTDKSRNSKTGGYGLGLAIAAAIVSAHKGKIFADTQDEHSLTITAVFPL